MKEHLFSRIVFLCLSLLIFQLPSLSPVVSSIPFLNLHVSPLMSFRLLFPLKKIFSSEQALLLTSLLSLPYQVPCQLHFLCSIFFLLPSLFLFSASLHLLPVSFLLIPYSLLLVFLHKWYPQLLFLQWF